MDRIIIFTSILLSSIALIIASVFQSKVKKKYKEVLDIIKDKENITINEISDDVNEKQTDTKLMEELYNKYFEFQNKLNNLDDNFDNLLSDKAKEYYSSIIESNKEKNYKNIKDKIDLIGYSIMEYKDKTLKFRLKINCLDYKLINDSIVSGSDKEKVEQVLIITYVNKEKWLIELLEKVYESRLDNKN